VVLLYVLAVAAGTALVFWGLGMSWLAFGL
jgi:hypothetical protein